jgi:MOSC domain-containing protein YiiM
MSQSTQGSVLELFVSIKGEKNRFCKKELLLDEQGVLEDKYYAKNTQRAILITSKESYTLARKNGIDTPYSTLGENILIDINPYHLSPKDRIQIGDVLVEITQNCTICNSLSKIDTSLPKLLENDRGIFARVIDAGTIKKGDKVSFFK